MTLFKVGVIARHLPSTFVRLFRVLYAYRRWQFDFRQGKWVGGSTKALNEARRGCFIDKAVIGIKSPRVPATFVVVECVEDAGFLVNDADEICGGRTSLDL